MSSLTEKFTREKWLCPNPLLGTSLRQKVRTGGSAPACGKKCEQGARQKSANRGAAKSANSGARQKVRTGARKKVRTGARQKMPQAGAAQGNGFFGNVIL
jgi:hypothetical protein